MAQTDESWITVDTRRLRIGPMMDGFVHILPRRTIQKHWIGINCWCDPRVTWREELETCLVSHRMRPYPEERHG